MRYVIEGPYTGRKKMCVLVLFQAPQKEAGTKPIKILPHSALSPRRKSKGKNNDLAKNLSFL